MADLWHYRLLGEEMGPVSGDALREMIHSGSLADDDLIQPADGDWMAIRDSELADAAPLDTGLADLLDSVNSSDCASAPEGELDSLLSSIVSEATPATTNRRSGGEWQCRMLGEELGPFDFDRLLQMVEAGELSPGDELRRGDSNWQRADSIVGLFPEGAATETTRAPEIRDEWYYDVEGRIEGPVSRASLQALATDGVIGPRDRVREGAGGRWLRAATDVTLFANLAQSRTVGGHARQASQTLAQLRSQADSAGNLAATTPSTPQEEPTTKAASGEEAKWSEFFEKAEQREQRKGKRSNGNVAAAAPSAASMPAQSLPASSAAVAASTSSHTPQAPTAAPRPAAFTPPPKVKSSRGPLFDFSGLKDRLGSLGGGVSAKQLAVLGALLLVSAIWFAPFSFAGTAGDEHYHAIVQLWQKAEKLAEAKADSSAWAALKSEAAPILTEVQQDLAPVVESKGRQAPLAQRLLWMVDVKDGPTRADGYLRKVIEAGPAATEEDVKNGAAIMSEAKQFVPPA